MKEIQLSQGRVAKVSDHRFEYLNQWKWKAEKTKKPGLFYVIRRDKNGRKISMHRVIMNPPDGKEIDHVDGDGLNNQDHNLRYCTKTQNQANRKKQSNNTSGYKGVVQSRTPGKWVAQIQFNHIKKYIGAFDTPEAAARAYDKFALEYFGEFANLNFKV